MKIGDFKGGYSVIPNNIKYVISPNAYMLLSIINEKSAGVISDNGVRITISCLQNYTHITRNTVKKSIKELENLKVVELNGGNKTAYEFHINWGAIYLICEKINGINSVGIDKIYNICHPSADEYVSCLDINDSIIDKIADDNQISAKGQNLTMIEAKGQNLTMIEAKGQNLTMIEANGQNLTLNESAKGQNLTMIEANGQNLTLNESAKGQNLTMIEANGQNLTLNEQVDKYSEKISISGSGNLESNGQNLTINGVNDGQNLTPVYYNIIKEENTEREAIKQVERKKEEREAIKEGEETETTLEDVLLEKNQNKQFENRSDSSILLNYNSSLRNNKKGESLSKLSEIEEEVDGSNSQEDEEMSYLYQGQKKPSEEKIKEIIHGCNVTLSLFSQYSKSIESYIQERSCDKYLAYEDFEFQDIIRNQSAHKLPEEKLIQEVWRDLKDDVESEAMENGEEIPANINGRLIDADFFLRDILAERYLDLTEEIENFQLSEIDAIAIFGFELAEGEDNQLIIQSNKIKDLSTSARASRKTSGMSSSEERHANVEYADKLIEAGKKYKDDLYKHVSDIEEAMYTLYEILGQGEVVTKAEFGRRVDEAIDGLEIDKDEFISALNLRPNTYGEYHMRYDFVKAKAIEAYHRAKNISGNTLLGIEV